MKNLSDYLTSNPYPGRGIAAGISSDGKTALLAYFIMGRSAKSRNRVFIQEGDDLRTEAFDPAKVEDPSLIIYSPVKTFGSATIITNGDQTDTVYDGLKKGLSFEESLRSRTFEPDAPNYTPRISLLFEREQGKRAFHFSIIKSDEGNPEVVLRYFYRYENPASGTGRFLHTYAGDGSPLPSFSGEPEKFIIGNENIDAFTNSVWNALNGENRISLFTRFVDLETGEIGTRIINKNR